VYADEAPYDFFWQVKLLDRTGAEDRNRCATWPDSVHRAALTSVRRASVLKRRLPMTLRLQSSCHALTHYAQLRR